MSKQYYTKCRKCHYCKRVEPEESGMELLADKVAAGPDSPPPRWFCSTMHMCMWKHETGRSLLSKESYENCLRVDGKLADRKHDD